MSLFRTVAPVVLLASAAYVSGAALPVAENVYTQDIDRSIKPGDDFYRYANGGWLARVTIPVGQSSFDTRAILTERTGQRVRDLVQGAAVGQPAKGSLAQKVGAYYASFIDEEAIEAKGLEPLAGEMATISAITDKASLSTYLGSTLNTEVDGLTSNADHIFGVWVNQGFEDSQRCLFHLWQGGLGMPDRDAYLDPSPKMAELRAQYQTHIAAMLKLASAADSKPRRREFCRSKYGSPKPMLRTPTQPMSSSRTILGNALTSTPKHPASIGTPISNRRELRSSQNSSFGSLRR